MTTPRPTQNISTLPSLRMMGGTALGVALGGLQTATAQTADTGANAVQQLPAVSVQGDQAAAPGYQVTLPSLDKLTSPLVSTPQSISEVPRQLLDDQGVSTIRDAVRNVPGVSLAAGEGAQQGDNLSIRGFNAQNDFYLDGMRDFGSYTRDAFNQQSVEVLEGPSSVLFGRGSTGGVVNQVSKQPELKSITGATVTLGTDGTYRFTSDINRQIPGLTGSAIRLNVMGNLNGTAGRDTAEARRFGFAPEAVFGLGTPTRLTLDYYHLQSYDTSDFGIPWLNGRPAPVGHSNYYGYPDTDFFRTNVDIGTIKLEHDINDAITVSNTLRVGSYYRAQRTTEPLILGYAPAGVTGNDIVRPGIPLSAIQISRNDLAISSHDTNIDDQLNGSFQFDTGPIHHNLVGGFELSRQTSDPARYTYTRTMTGLINPTTPVGGPPGFTVSSIASAVVNDAAIYAVDTANLGQHFDVIFGWRWDRSDSVFKQYGTTVVNARRNDDMPSYRAALVYKPTDYGSIYVDYGTSFDPSAEALSLSAATATVAPESSTTYELGTKWDLLGKRLSLSGSIYQIEMGNVRETDPNNATQDILAGDYRVRGFQIGATGHLTDRWEIFAGYGFNDAIVVKSPNPLEVGNVPPNAPKHTLSAFTTYRLPWHDIEIGGGINYISGRTASSTPVAGTNIIEKAPGYWTMSLMAKYPIRPGLSLQANVTNVTNTYYYDALHPSHIILGPSRAALFTLDMKL